MRTHAGVVTAVLVLAAAIISACAPSPTIEEDVGPSGVLRVRDGSATVTAAGQQDDSVDVAEAEERELSPGDVVTTTGDDAMVDVAWSDGAVTRLGPGTTFTVGDPGGPFASRGHQEGGVSWNRAPDTLDYAIDVAGAGRARDRGEVFVVDCREEPCRVRATGGVGGDGSLTSVRRGAVVSVVDSARLASWGELLADEWSRRSAELDAEGGMTPVADLFAEADPSRGILDGAFDVRRTGVESECTGATCDQLFILRPGQTRDLTFVFHLDCASGTCEASVDTQTISTADGSLLDATTGLVAGADDYTWGTDDARPLCLWTYADGTTEEVGSARNTVRWTVTPTAAEVEDGRFVVTELRGRTESSFRVTEEIPPGYPGCEAFEVEWSGASDLVLTKRGD